MMALRIAIVSLFTFLAACSTFRAAMAAADGSASPVGRYYSVHDLRSFTLLASDGTFFAKQEEQDFRGTYHVKGSSLLLTPDDLSMSLLGSLTNNLMVDNEGHNWLRPPHCLLHHAVVPDVVAELEQAVPDGWYARPWDGRYYIGKIPEGPPPSFLDAEAIVVVLQRGSTEELATALNMIADTSTATIHLSVAPEGTLWPTAVNDIVKAITMASSGVSQPARFGAPAAGEGQ